MGTCTFSRRFHGEDGYAGLLWKLFNNHRSLFAQHSGATLARCAYFPSGTQALAVPVWPGSIPRTAAPARPQSHLHPLPRPTSDAAGTHAQFSRQQVEG